MVVKIRHTQQVNGNKQWKIEVMTSIRRERISHSEELLRSLRTIVLIRKENRIIVTETNVESQIPLMLSHP